MEKKKAKALVLFSGGLDSQLAVKTLLNQGIEVIAVCFRSPFFTHERAEKAAAALGVPLVVEQVDEDILALVKNPPHGLGKNLNPCIDCHAMMFAHCARLLDKLGADFLASGEVLGQRPMSQTLISLGIVAKTSGIAQKILRPLSAQLLPETEMEKSGLVDRSQLLKLNGRSRKPQAALAAEWGITDYPSPAGGCLLTEPEFCRRMRALMRLYPDPTINSIEKLKVGRQFFLSNKARLIVGRNEADNLKLEKLALPGDTLLFLANDMSGPLAVLEGEYDDSLKELAARVVVRYGEPSTEIPLPVEVHCGDKMSIIEALPINDRDLDLYR